MTCPKCGGDGFIVESDHHPDCDGEATTCSLLCPVQVQILCSECGGIGRVPDPER